MKKIGYIMVFLLLGAATNVSAQSQDKKKEPFEKKVSKFWKKTKKELEQAGHELGDAIGFDDRLSGKSDLLKVNGSFYMPLYSKDLYKGEDALTFRKTSTQLFRKKYPKVNIQSVSIPQKEWVLEAVEKDGELVGYQRTLHCFIIARDGDEGYVNAKFTYRQYKNVGQEFQNVKDWWPKWERTDFMTNSVYEQLLKL
ncbi:teichoic acid biosynthesis protein B [Hoylesella timonensis]|uniref:teichoic acid biosynthesis protein B n=1 Tax=Hoylesella timonensis TaxID=386414 RepID=UPI00336A8892